MAHRRLQLNSPVTHPLTAPVTTVTLRPYRRHTGPFRALREATVWGISPDISGTQQGRSRRR
jgi:peroxiredoxin